ncbi:restriction endonuclease subunit S [Lactiplantibacillus daoliensis]|uniref:Restriction endonuclease subunit S n=1 Tax=Lactiplantibacillus daoliensis TaxID=2559916 RepID=A0ABW1ULI3_9LACO|nr:restriction endonuclease subunit S [Lactiplantibacillus daoliensis]
MKDEKLTPEIRFKGFTDPWEQRKLKNISEINPMKEIPQNFLYVDLESVQEEKIKKYQIQNRNNAPSRAQRLAKEGDIFFQNVRSYQKNNVIFEQSFNTDPVVFSTGYTQIRTSQDSSFVMTQLQTNNFVNRVLARSTGTSYPAITSKNLGDMKISLPNLSEQLKVGMFFQGLSKLIAANEEKVDELKAVKKLLMQRLFDQSWRFKGFTDPWEQRKLGELFSERTERSSNGTLLSVTINSGIVKFDSLDRKNNSSEDKSNYKIVKKNDIAYNSMRMWQGANGVSNYDGIVSPAYTVITPRKNVFSDFFGYHFKQVKMLQVFQKNSQGLTSDTWNLKYPSLKGINVKIPSMNEQKHISRVLKKIDENIAANEEKCEQLKQLKQYLMQNMFV